VCRLPLPSLLRSSRTVGCTLAWLDRSRRLAKDIQATIGSATAWLYLTALAIEWE
jgi:hypothetical protein